MSAESFENSSGFKFPDVSNIDLKKLQPKIQQGPDYIPTASKRGRDVITGLFFNTGALWLTGYSAGASYGCIEGIRNAVNPSIRIRMNSVLNSVTKRGSRLGNALGIIGKFI